MPFAAAFPFLLNFWRKEGKDMAKERHIWLNGVNVAVTEEVYRVYKRAEWREEKQRKASMVRECSYDFMCEHGTDGRTANEQKLVEDIGADKMLVDALYAALAELTDDERRLIHALYYKEKTERDVAMKLGATHQAVHKKKANILLKLLDLLAK
jgi:DNA-directed RNA polymerase specialized sigma subunit